MHVNIDGKNYEVIIEKKNNKNTYLRVKEDLKIHISTSYLTPNFMIKKIINDNLEFIKKQIKKQSKKIEKQDKYYYLGKEINIVIIDIIKKAYLENDILYVKDIKDVDLWYKSEMKRIFKERFDNIYNNFSRNIPYPKLVIRKMSTRWGVCNTKLLKITLNSELIYKDIKCLDYVIVHELSHLIHGNHGKEFWALVEENKPDYKLIRKEMRE